MAKHFWIAAGVALVSAAAGTLPSAAANRTIFVSGHGTDSGTCAFTAPCRTFAYAVTQAVANGEIVVLDSAGYGQVTITKSVSITNDSSTALINVASGDGITINAGASDSVVLRGLTIDGLGTGTTGIVFNSGGSLTIRNCNVSGASGNGILLRPTGSASPNVRISETDSSNNGYAGIWLMGNSLARVEIDHVVTNNNQFGLALYGAAGAHFSVSQSIASNNSVTGFDIEGAYGTALDMLTVTGNQYGINTGSGTTYLGRSVVSGNLAGILHSLYSYRDNRINGNGTDISASATITAAGLQ